MIAELFKAQADACANNRFKVCGDYFSRVLLEIIFSEYQDVNVKPRCLRGFDFVASEHFMGRILLLYKHEAFPSERLVPSLF